MILHMGFSYWFIRECTDSREYSLAPMQWTVHVKRS